MSVTLGVGENAATYAQIRETGIMPPEIASEIITASYGESIVGRLAGNRPMAINGYQMAVATGDPVAGVVNEGEAKPVIKSAFKTKTIHPVKVAAIAYWTKEARMADPAGYMQMIMNQAKDAITKAIDLAVIHGINGVTGELIAGDREYLTKSANTIDLGTSAGGIGDDVLAGYEQVLNAGGQVTGFAVDSAYVPALMRARDKAGLPIYASVAGGTGAVDLSKPLASVHGLPAAIGRGVGGKIGRVPDKKTRIIGGDFTNNLRFGFVEQMTIRTSSDGTIVDGDKTISLFQQNMEAMVIEAMFGWAIGDVDQFTVLKVS